MIVVGVAGMAGLLYYLYMRQLGAISFFVLAVLFFSLSFANFNDRDKKRKHPILRLKKRR